MYRNNYVKTELHQITDYYLHQNIALFTLWYYLRHNTVLFTSNYNITYIKIQLYLHQITVLHQSMVHSHQNKGIITSKYGTLTSK